MGDHPDRGEVLMWSPAQRWFMKIRQNIRHFAAKKALTLPVIRDVANEKLVDLHTKIFLAKADPDTREERRAHLDAFFDATIDAYLAALNEGYSEAHAREITHVQGNFDFFNHGWTEMMEIPIEELDAHYDRHRSFFERHGITIEEPLGEFAPTDGVPDAPTTLEKLDEPAYRNAVSGYADDVYVEDASGTVRIGGTEEPEDVDVRDAPGIDGEDADDPRQ